MEPDWDLAVQPAPNFEVDQRVNWSMVEAAILTRCALAMRPTYAALCQSLSRTAHFGAGLARHGLTATRWRFLRGVRALPSSSTGRCLASCG